MAALTTAVSLALVAGMTEAGTAAAVPAPAGNASQARSAAGQPSWITLITGDRVRVDAKGKVTGFDHAEGRAGIPVGTYTDRGHTYVVPHDARRLVADGRLDRRLFDITELGRAESRNAHRDGLRLIVAYGGSAGAGARRSVRAADGTEFNRALKTLNADAVTSTPELWETITRDSNDGARVAASGISRIWLDGIRSATLERSTGQIGAPKAWQAGYQGKGVKIAVLDTGVDADHPDLKGRVVAAQNFGDSPDTRDRVGHGTHAASIAAGSGAHANGTHRGVAPQAEILNGKVLNDLGRGTDSGIIAGMEWAVAQGADIVNLSLGGQDTQEIDPLEATVNKLSAQTGVLFAVAAGNAGPNGIDSPGSADGAFTVGAVDRADRLAGFSSTGPRVGGGAVKPDVAAPGVDISAAATGNGSSGSTPGYLSMSGTSMATPHVAGAAALLKQQHPGWKAKELRSALASSAKDTGHTPHEQGSGRIAIDKAIIQTVISEETSLDFGKQAWPHTDDTPVTKKITYRNSGSADITLDLAVTAHGPGSTPVPAGFFTLGTNQVTVPAEGTASVDFTADTQRGGDDGHYSATVVASGGGQTVRSTAAIEREAESYDVTFKHIGRDGKPSRHFRSGLNSLTALHSPPRFIDSSAGDLTVRLPKGEYVLDSNAPVDPKNPADGIDVLLQPKLTVDKAQTVTLDARLTRPVKLTVPHAKARIAAGMMEYNRTSSNGRGTGGYFPVDSFDTFNIAHLGPQITDGSLNQIWVGNWRKNSRTEYNAASGGPVKRIATGYTRDFRAAEFATVKVGLGASVKGKRATVEPTAYIPGGHWGMVGFGVARPSPDTRTVYVSNGDRVRWNFYVGQVASDDPNGGYQTDLLLNSPPKTYRAGKTHQETFNTAVFGPMLDQWSGLWRYGDQLVAQVPLFADGRGNSGTGAVQSARTTLHRNGTRIGENSDALTGRETLPIGREAGQFTLTTSVTRSATTTRVSSRIDAEWTFRADAAPTDGQVTLPISTVRFTGAQVGLDSTAPAGATQTIPLQLHGAAAKGNIASLTAQASYDGGKTWRKLTVTKNKVTVKNPAKGRSITLRAQVADRQGGMHKVTVHNAFFGG
ncbi:S8 family serine peptidase [Streptomyces sp. CWNU-1]|uniref:S8 family serine peptidase n=2 Tax=Streptomyces albipurpureus TaxID=2897419 RepID=A0ABT0UMW0_9ACTN|nr:S8 family serine peptidase [Streptomyces sp. CWNU-1]